MPARAEQPRVSVIIATWNACEVLSACLDSVERQEVEGGFETLVVDNASTDATAELLRRYEDRVSVISNSENALYASANNQAARVARGRVLFFLNPDTELLGSTALECVTRVAEDPCVAIAGPMLVNPDRTLQPSCAGHPSVGRALLVGCGLHRFLPDSARAKLAPDHWSHDRAVDTGWLMGAAIAVRADLFRELGGFWDSLYAEEQDLAYRAQREGLRIRFEPAAKVIHLGNHSTAKRWTDAERAAKVAAAELAFLQAHYGRARAAFIRAVTGLAYAGRALAFALIRRHGRAATYRAMARVYASGDAPTAAGPGHSRRA